MTCYVSSGTLNFTHSLTLALEDFNLCSVHMSVLGLDLLCRADGSSSADRVIAAMSSRQAASAASSSRLSKSGSGEKKPKTIQEDSQATEVFKSLFNTHKTAKQQQKAHWVTYNPQYF